MHHRVQRACEQETGGLIQLEDTHTHWLFTKPPVHHPANQIVELPPRSPSGPHLDDLPRPDDDLLRVREPPVIRDKDCPRRSVSRQEQVFERSSQRKRSHFEQMEKNFNIDSTEASERVKQSSSRRRGRPSGRGRRGRRGGYRGVRRDARGGVRGGVEGDAAGGTDVPMMVLRTTFQST